MISRPLTRLLAHWAAVAVGGVVGLVMFGIGLRGLFVMNSNDTWVGIIAALAGTLTLLPLSILGIFKPAAAGCGIIISCAVSLVGAIAVTVSSGGRFEFSTSGLAWFFFFFGTPSAVATLLLYASGQGPPRLLSRDSKP